ncbi:MAG: hypothetical protein D6775_08340 [Caldilineae bacterium]|nr:MAG: hypothetical protein D6775_08340 [Caldilineae bacterium]
MKDTLMVSPLLAGLLALLLSACAAPPPPAPAGSEPPTPGPVEEAAIGIAARDLEVEAGDVRIVSVEEVMWRDASLGCPREGMVAAQVLTPGYRVVVEVKGEQYNVHMNREGQGVVCLP